MKKIDIVAVASKLISQRAAQIWGDCELHELGDWATTTDFPLEHQGNADMPYLMCKVSDMNLIGNEIYIKSTVNTFDDTIAKKLGAKILPKGTVVFPKRGGAIATNKRRILEHPTAIDTNMLGVIPNKNILPKWLYFLFRGIDFSKFQSGTSVPAINQKDLANIKVPSISLDTQQAISDFLTELEGNPNRKGDLPKLPLPLEEQRRTVVHIEALAVRVNEAQRLREEADLETELLVGREIASLFANAKDWNSYNLGDLISEMSYGTSAKAHNERVGIPVLRMGNIQNGKLDLTDLKFMHPSEQEMNKLRLQKGDILVNRTNSAELVGKCAVFELEGDYLFASYIIRIRLDQQKADPRLVAQYINSPAGRAYMFAERKQMTGQANVNSKKLAALPISLPPLDEQRHIVAYLDGLQAKVNALRELQSASGEELSALLPSILDKAFRGEL